MARSTPLPVRSRIEVADAFPAHRQSTLASFDSCRLMTRWDLEGVGFDNAAQARGTLFHRVAAEILRTMWRTGNGEIPTEEALAILYEVCAQRDVPDADVIWCPSAERRMLRQCVLGLVWDRETRKPRRFNVGALMSIEERLHAPISYDDPDGGRVERVITGQPDAIIAEPPDGVVVLDWKTTRRPPPKGPEPREERGDHHDDAEHVSYLGYFQQRTYAFLVLSQPDMRHVRYVKLREFYPLAGEARYATVYRADLEHVERELSTLVEHLDRALMGGHRSAMWKPSPGKHCGFCSRPTHCPIEADVRVFANGGGQHAGGITSKTQAAKLAGEAIVAKMVYDKIMGAMKPYVDVHGPVDAKDAKGRMQLRWKRNASGNGRRFGFHVPDDSDRGPDDPDLAAAFDEARERVAS
jgi:hypothetical protein